MPLSYSIATFGLVLAPLDIGATCMESLAPPVSQEDKRCIDCSDEPQEHIDQVDPDCILHPNDAILMRCCVGSNKYFAENAKEGHPQDAGIEDQL